MAEELTSDAFLALHQHIASIDTSQLPSWLFTVVRNRATDYWRRQGREQDYLAESARYTAPSREDQETVETWVARHPGLKPVHRLCIILRYVYGMTREEIAQQAGLTDNQVKGHLQYALTLMRREMERT